MNKINKQIDKLLDEAGKLALQEIEKLARKILKEHKHLHEFVMAMGTFFFIDKDGNTIETTSETYKNYDYTWEHSHKYFESLNEFISQYDDVLNLTGEPMRFTATGEIIRNW